MKINRRQFHDLIEVYDTVDNHDRQLQPERGEETKRYGKAPHRADISLHIDTRCGNLIAISAIDNMVKGAAGQAIQNMNLIFGLEEASGLALVPPAF